MRKGNLRKTDLTAVGYDQDCSFMLVEIAGDELYFQTISRAGVSVDFGLIRRVAKIAGPGSRPAVGAGDGGLPDWTLANSIGVSNPRALVDTE